jgi:hypothetical protein
MAKSLIFRTFWASSVARFRPYFAPKTALCRTSFSAGEGAPKCQLHPAGTRKDQTTDHPAARLHQTLEQRSVRRLVGRRHRGAPPSAMRRRSTKETLGSRPTGAPASIAHSEPFWPAALDRGVRRAFLWMSIRLSQGTLMSRQHQLPRPEPDGQPIESSQLERKSAASHRPVRFRTP